MKRESTSIILAMLALAMLGGCAGAYDQASSYERSPSADEDVSYFYDALAPYGDWIWTDDYGWVWCPTTVPVYWRPYTYGQWIWTDDGWTWVADEDWGWGPSHYGRWYDDSTNGWCWVPGQVWAPAWVLWRAGDGWIGWAPMPPEIIWRDDAGFAFSDWDNPPGVRHHWWRFCQERDLPGPGLRDRLAPRPRGVILLKYTHNITNYTLVNAHVVNRSLDLERIRQASGRDIRVYRVADLAAPPASHGRQIARDEFFAYRPRLREAPRDKAPRRSVIDRPSAPPDAAAPPAPAVGPRSKTERKASDEQRRAELELERRQAAERKRLEQEQRRDAAQPPRGVTPAELRQQHEAEQRALEEQAARDKRVLEARQQLEQRRKSREEPSTPAGKTPPGGKRQPAKERDEREGRGR